MGSGNIKFRYLIRRDEIAKTQASPSHIWRMMGKLNKTVALNYQRGIGPSRVVMLLTTTGRKSGLPRLTPLQFEELDGKYYLGSARGVEADWFRNAQANPRVQCQIRDHKFDGVARAITSPEEVADLLALRLKRHPLMIGLLMRLEGLPLRFKRSDLEHFATGKAFIEIIPSAPESD
jgi:deazaflavin-dependent oxidoreductase (nitroreductase family)